MCACGEDTSTSMSLSSSSPSRSFLRYFCRVADSSSPPVFPERPASPGSGGPYAQAAARALLENTKLDAESIVRKSLSIAADLCIYTNQNQAVEVLE